jgi:hypothetical protein
VIELSASILSANFAQPGAEVTASCDAGIRRIHIDVMDGHFVPDLSTEPEVVRALRPLCDRYGTRLDVHLMIETPIAFWMPSPTRVHMRSRYTSRPHRNCGRSSPAFLREGSAWVWRSIPARQSHRSMMCSTPSIGAW